MSNKTQSVNPLNHMSTVTVRAARLSFPALFKPKSFEEGGEAKFSASALLDKKLHASVIVELKAAMKTVAEEKWGTGKIPSSVKYALRDGAEKADMDGYGEGVMFFSASSKNRPPVVDKDVSPLDGSNGKPYAGCYVNIHVRAWAQDNKFGKRVNFELKAMQFVKDGDPFGEKPTDAAEVFKPVDESDDEAAALMGNQ